MGFKRVSCCRYFAADTQARSKVVTPISVELHDFIVVHSEESGKTEATSDENSVPQSLQRRDVGVKTTATFAINLLLRH